MIAEIGQTAAIDAEHRVTGASMRPRSDDRGNNVNGTAMLPSGLSEIASMRPRSDDRGNSHRQKSTLRPGPVTSASMRPRSDDRGNKVLAAEKWRFNEAAIRSDEPSACASRLQ